MKRKTGNSFSTFFSTIIMGLIICLLVGFVYKRTDEFTTGFKSFYIEYGNTQINDDFSYLTFKVGETYKFKVNSTIDNLTGNDRDYMVSVIPNPNQAFEFTAVDKSTGESLTKSLSDIDLNLYFEFSFNDDGFTIADNRGNLDGFIESYLSNYEIDFKEKSPYSKNPYYRIVVESLKDVETINIDFNLTGN